MIVLGNAIGNALSLGTPRTASTNGPHHSVTLGKRTVTGVLQQRPTGQCRRQSAQNLPIAEDDERAR